MRFPRSLIGAILGLSALSVFAYFPVHAQPVFDPGLARAIEVQERHTDELLSNSGVVGTAVGRDGGGVAVVVILVVNAKDVRGLPSTLDGVPVRVRQAGRIYAFPKCAQPPCGNGGGGGGGEDNGGASDTTARWTRPVPIGISTGHPAITAGTIGARVTDGASVYALSNNHVYANENLAAITNPVLQPGPYDGGTHPADDIGNLADFEPINFGCSCTTFCLCLPALDNTIDAAIASTSTANLGTSTPSDGYGTPRTITAAPAIDMRVQKFGRTTKQTSGRISEINATVVVGYSHGYARFVNQIIIRPGPFSAGGDSGSLIVVDAKGTADDRKPVGLLFAGSSSVTVANPINAVLGRFGVTVDGAP